MALAEGVLAFVEEHPPLDRQERPQVLLEFWRRGFDQDSGCTVGSAGADLIYSASAAYHRESRRTTTNSASAAPTMPSLCTFARRGAKISDVRALRSESRHRVHLAQRQHSRTCMIKCAE